MILAPYKRYIIAAAVLVGAFWLTGWAVGRHFRSQLADAQSAEQRAHAALAGAVAAAKAESAWATSLGIVANSESQRAARIEALRAVAADSANVWRGRYLSAIKSSPDTCKAVVATANGVINSLDAVNTLLKAELDTTRLARNGFHASADSMRAAFNTLSGPVARVDGAAQRLAGASKEPFLSRIAPKPGFGFFAGVSSAGHPVVGAGVTFGWHF